MGISMGRLQELCKLNFWDLFKMESGFFLLILFTMNSQEHRLVIQVNWEFCAQ